MTKSALNIGEPEVLEKKRALEFLALSPTEKYYVIMNLIKVSYEIRNAGLQIPNKFDQNIK